MLECYDVPSPVLGWVRGASVNMGNYVLHVLACVVVLNTIQCGVLEHKEQRILQGRPLSNNPRQGDTDYEYDHDAFLGDDEAEYFDTLDPEESKRRLGIICDKIDTDQNSLVNLEELQKWIQYVQEREVREDTERQWEEKTKGKLMAFEKGILYILCIMNVMIDTEDQLSWESYKDDVYGFVDAHEEAGYNFKPMMERDYRRWQKADSDNDDKLNKEEFQAFLHPEDVEHMRDILVLETLEDMDTDKDGSLSVDEYIGDMYKELPGGSEPDWVTQEKTLFGTERDKDGDGFMNFEEVKRWIVPDDFDHSLGEARHLIVQADMNGDSFLTKEEILEQYEMFVGSSATQFGEILRRHDEF